MKVLIQRISEATVKVSDKTISEIKGQGILALTGFGREDNEESLDLLLQKLVHLRIFPDSKGRFDKSLLNIKGRLMLVPQFTLYADTTKGRRPEFFSAMPPEEAHKMFNHFTLKARKLLGENQVVTGTFGADMQISLINDGPVTIMLEN